MRAKKIALWVSILAIAGAIAAGCGSNSANTEAPAAVATPRFVNDLSSLSSKSVNPLSDAQAAFAATHAHGGGDSDEESGMEDKPGTKRYVGTEEHPCTETLLNPKAAQFAMFSGELLDHLWGEVRKRQDDDAIARLKLPTDLRPVILTATLNSSGKLKEIVLEQHSGKGAIDRMFIDAAKKALWAANPPGSAADPDGKYRVRVQLHMENYASSDNHTWNFKTQLGIALL